MGSNIIKQKLISSTRENLSGLKDLLMGLKAEKSDKNLVEEAFRAIQFIRETSLLVGYDNVTEISGEMESLFDLICKDQRGITTEMTELCFNAIDFLKDILSEGHVTSPGDILSHQELMVSFERLKSAYLVASEKQNSEVYLSDNKKSTWHIILYLNKNIIPDSVNLVNVFHDLFLLGEYKIYRQSSKYEENQCWSIFLSTYKGYSEIEAALFLIKSNCRIFKIADYDIFNNEPPAYKGNIEDNGNNNVKTGMSDRISNNGEDRHNRKSFFFIQHMSIDSNAAGKSVNIRMIGNSHQPYSFN